ncbi:hypothetical protein STRIP9103_00101, partial [Streptomyces ipomoeae 91-03]
RLTT